ncbi:MAG: iron-containing redox enzyme family protein [Ramlibacter sp.]|nr:iron-containing redox enzyme family protein [Ramlibacter sp.]
MYASPREWQLPQTATEHSLLADDPRAHEYASLYNRLLKGTPDESTRGEAAVFLRHELALGRELDDELPQSADQLHEWMEANTLAVHSKYTAYLAQRKTGSARRFFTNRAHALYVLRNVAPTKLVDGAWLYGLVKHAHNPKLSDLVRTYVEELGAGDASKNHVVLYRELPNRYNLDPLDDIGDEFYRQGLIQLALGWNAQAFLPEVIGFNLGYEQLPLHLLIMAHELNELGLDPYYFTLHVTVDNGDTGHARRACEAVLEMMPHLDDDGAFWQRVRAGSKLGSAGAGTMDAINNFDIDKEVLRILAQKSVVGNGAHSDYCRVAGKSVNEWLSCPAQIAGFLAALEGAGWIKRGLPPAQSRFWALLQGPRAEMFGVFSSYELQVIHDWIRGEASADGAAFTDDAAPQGHKRRASFRSMERVRPTSARQLADDDLLDPDLIVLRQRLATACAQERAALLVELMSPALHWTPAGIVATREFWSAAH